MISDCLGKLLEGVNNSVGVNPFLSISCISIPDLGVTGVSSGFDVEDFGVIKSVFFDVIGVSGFDRYLLDFF